MRNGLLRKPVVLFGPILDKVIFTHVVVIGLPTVLYCWILANGGNLIALHVVIPILYFITSLVVLSEAVTTVLAYRRGAARPGRLRLGLIQRMLRLPRLSQSTQLATLGTGVDLGLEGSGALALEPPDRFPSLEAFPQRLSQSALPKCSLIVAAYLPNEQQIIGQTLDYILTTIHRPAGGLEVILAYNTPTPLPVEAELAQMALRYPELRLLKVEGSRSKAENLNAALQIVTGEVTGILDADHQPNPDCFERAWGWLAHNQYTVVQGRNVIRNRQGFLTRMIAVEFECMYGVSHPAKSLLVDTGMFCGSNGYWRTNVLRRIGFVPTMLTEDIDATLRTLLRGHHIVHDPTIVTTELAPEDVRSFWFQRKRWAQGWLEVALKYQMPMLRSAYLDPWQKGYWTMLLMYSAIFHFIALQIFPIFFSLAIAGQEAPLLAQEFVWMTTTLTLLSGPCQTLAAWLVRSRAVKHSVGDFLLYCLFIPFYCLFKNVIAIIAIYDHVLGNTEWVVTRRSLRDREPVMPVYAGSVSDRVS
jgi:cellulose synthase/poly-beta-1,6-N-acetylglucosamine synthase-like glycosyltransferase